MPIGRMQLPRELRSSGGIMDWVGQGGMKNYLGEQPMVTAPKFWRSGPDSPPTELAYITDAEKDLIMRADLHGSLSQGPNEGPSGIMSLNGWGSTDPGQNRAGAEISAAMDTDPGGKGAEGWADTKMAHTTATGMSPAELKLAEQANAKKLGLDLSNKRDYQKFHSLGKWKVNPKTGRMGGGLGSLFGFLTNFIPGIGVLKNIAPGINQWQRGWRKKLTGYETQAEYDKALRDRRNQKRVDYMFNRKNQGLGYGEKNLNELLAQGYVPTVLQGNELGLFTDRMSTNPTHGNDLDNAGLLSITDNPLTQKLMTKTSSPISNLQERLNIVNQLDMPLNYSASDLQARARRAMTQPGTLATIDPLGMGTVTSYDPYKEMYSTFTRSDIDPAFQNMVTPIGWESSQKGMVESLKDLGFKATDAYKKLSDKNVSPQGIFNPFKTYPNALQPQEFYDKWYGGSFDPLPQNKRKYQVPQEVDTQIQNIYKDYI